MVWLSLPPLELTATSAPRSIISWHWGGAEMRRRPGSAEAVRRLCGPAPLMLPTRRGRGAQSPGWPTRTAGVIRYSSSPIPSKDGRTVTAAMAAAGWPFAVHENRQKLSNFPLVRASNARRCSSVMLVVSGMASVSVTVARGALSGPRVSTGRRRPRPPFGRMHRCGRRRAGRRRYGDRGVNRVPCPRGMGIGAVTG